MARQQEQKEREARPYQPSKAERIAEQFEEGQWLISPNPRGFYPYFDSVYPGTGFTVGMGYRRYVGYESYLDVHGLYAISNSTLFEVSFLAPNRFGGHVDVGGKAGRRSARGIAYYGLGMSSTEDDVAYTDVAQRFVEGSFYVRPKPWLELGGTAAYENFDERLSSVEPRIVDVYTPVTAPRLGAQPSYLHGKLSGAILWLQSPGYSRRGGLYRFTYHGYEELTPHGGRFGLYRGELVQHIPILRENWVLSLRGRMESIVDRTTEAPYFLLPYLGSGGTLRAYDTGRFRGRHAVLATAEWRWIPSRLGMDMAIFADGGTVAMKASELLLKEAKYNYGIGIRLHSPQVTVIRVEIAHGSDGWRSVFSASPVF